MSNWIAQAPPDIRFFFLEMFLSTTVSSPLDPNATGAVVWDRLWQSEPSLAKDDTLLTRERNHPRWSWIRRRLEQTFGSLQGLRTVELGSGRGDLSALLAQHGANVTLLDTSEHALRQAQHRFNRLGLSAAFEKGDLFDASALKKTTFDVALSSGVIEHFVDEQRTQSIAAHASAVRTGGVVVLSVPHAHCPTYRLWKLYLECRRWWPYGLELPYSRRELTRRASQSGLSELESVVYGFWQSIGDHGLKTIFGRTPDWSNHHSWLDRWFGATLVLMGRKTP